MARRSSRRNSSDEKKPSFSRQESLSLAKFLLSFIQPYKVKFFTALFIMIVSSVISLTFPFLTGKLIDVVLHPEKAEFPIGTTIIGLLVFLLLQSLTRYWTSTTLARISEEALSSLRTLTYSRLLRLPMSFFGERRVGELASRLTSDASLIQETFTFSFLEFLRQGVFLIGGIAFIALHSLALTGFVLLSLPPLALIGIVFGKKIRTYSRAVQDAIGEAATVVEESLQAISDVKSFHNEEFETKRYTSSIRKGVEIAIKGAKIRSAFVSFIIFAIFGGLAGVIWYGGSLVRGGELTIGELTSFMMYAMFVAGAFGSFAELFGQFQRTLGASHRIKQILEETTETSLPTETFPLNDIRFHEVVFAYPERKDTNALDGISFSVEAGKRVALVGESGSGKSTIARLLQGFYNPQKGGIYFNNINSHEISLFNIRHNVGIVPQDIVLFGGTIKENILYGNPHASDEEIRNAATLANAADFIAELPDGYNTLIGERGVKLSGGQRQRIAIARALLKNSPILILDEATSALDTQTERLIQQATERLTAGRTTLIIAHRLSTVRSCDSIIVLKKGQIIEQGTHDELLANNGYYAHLCALQFS